MIKWEDLSRPVLDEKPPLSTITEEERVPLLIVSLAEYILFSVI